MSPTATTASLAPRALADLPGPRGCPVVGNSLQIERKRFHQHLEAWAREYGDTYVFRIGKRRFLVNSAAESIGTVLLRRPDAFRRTDRVEQFSLQFVFLGLFSANGD